MAISNCRLNFLGGHSALDTKKKSKTLAGAARSHYFQKSLTFLVFKKKKEYKVNNFKAVEAYGKKSLSKTNLAVIKL